MTKNVHISFLTFAPIDITQNANTPTFLIFSIEIWQQFSVSILDDLQKNVMHFLCRCSIFFHPSAYHHSPQIRIRLSPKVDGGSRQYFFL